LGKAIIHYVLAAAAKREIVAADPTRKTLFVQNCSATETVRLSNDLNAPANDSILVYPQEDIWLLKRDHVHPETAWYVQRYGDTNACVRYLEGFE